MNHFNQLTQEEEEDELHRKQQINQQDFEDLSLSIPHKVLLIIAIITLLITSFLRNNKDLLSHFSSLSDVKVLPDNLNKLLQSQQIISEESLINLTQNQKYDSSSNVTVNKQIQIKKRIAMGSPHRKNWQMKVVKLFKQQSFDKSQCLLINGITVISNITINTIQSIFSLPNFHIAILILDSHDQIADRLWKSLIINDKFKLKYNQTNVIVDSEYKFIRSFTNQCERIIYVQNYFLIGLNQSNLLKEVIYSKYVGPGTVLYSLCARVKQQSKDLIDLNTSNLQRIQSNILTQYLFIFDAKYLRLITPLNYAFYAKYTLQQFIIQPIIAIARGSFYFVGFKQLLHSFQRSFTQFKQFSIHQVNKYDHILSKTRPVFFKKSEDFCFVSYPLQSITPSFTLFSQYFLSLVNIKNVINSTLVVNLPYSFDTLTRNGQQLQENLLKYFLFLLTFTQNSYNIRLRIRVNKTASSLCVYEAVHTYCPNSSIIIASRHNIKFQSHFITKLSDILSFKHHYYYCSHISSQNTQVKIKSPLKYKKKQIREKGMYYKQYFENLQIFKSDLFKMIYFWILKKQEIGFYESQASFVTPLLEMVRLSVGIVPQVSYQVFNPRSQNKNELFQIQNLKLYYQWTPIINNVLTPFKYNSLQNQAFRRYAPEIIPKIIHQAWIGGKDVSVFQEKLHNTLKTTNQDFKLKLWRDQNITFENFPLTYALIKRSLQYQRFSNRSYSAPIVSLVRYQALYQKGGIYIDFKTQGKKNLGPFLKYEIFFIDVDYEKNHYLYPSNVGNGIMGAIKGNYHLKLVLTQLVNQDKFNYKFFDFPKIVGGYILRKSLTDREVFKVAGYGFQLFSQKPGTGKPNLCSRGLNQQFKQTQQVFKVVDYQTDKAYKIGIPCEIYPEAYLIMYKVLAGTWKQKKKHFISHKPRRHKRIKSIRNRNFKRNKNNIQ